MESGASGPGVPSRWRAVVGLALVLAAAAAVRLQSWNDVFVEGRDGAALLGDTDPYYHVLRAERIAANYPRVPWHDDRMNHPVGSDILWPPLFDHAIATGALIVDGGHPTRATVERVAAALPPILGVATVALVAMLGAMLLGEGLTLGAALLLALLPAHVEFSILGRADQHVAELLLQTLVMLTFVAAWRTERVRTRRSSQFALGVALCLSFWNWQGSALYLVLLVVPVTVWHLADAEGTKARRINGTLAWGTAFGAVLIFASVLIWGRPGAAFANNLSGITGVQSLFTAIVAAYAFGLQAAISLRRGASSPGKRAVEIVLAGLIPVAATWVLLPGVRDAIRQGLLALTAGNPWYASIKEFQPLLFSGAGLSHELKAWVPRFALLFVMPLAALALWRKWRARPDNRPALVFLAVWGLMLLTLTLARLRFVLYLSVPAAIWGWIGLRELAGLIRARSDRRWTHPAVLVTGIAILLAPALFYFSHGGLRRNSTQVEVVSALEWLRSSAAPRATRTAVFSEWDWGHLIQYFGDRPAVATPFGTDGGAGAMEDTTRFFLTTSAEEAERILAEREAGYLMMVDPLTHAAESATFVSSETRPPISTERHWLRGPRLAVTPEVDDLVAVRLYVDNGLSARGKPTITGYRLVYEGSPLAQRQVRLFEIVRGAELILRGAPRGTYTRVAVGLRTNQGRSRTWSIHAALDKSGTARVRVPYATGQNGAVEAGLYFVSADGVEVKIAVPSAAIESGETIAVDLSTG